MTKRGYSRINVSRVFDLNVEEDEQAIQNFMTSTLCFFKGKRVAVKLEIREAEIEEGEIEKKIKKGASQIS